jgi:hypothetical protein
LYFPINGGFHLSLSRGSLQYITDEQFNEVLIEPIKFKGKYIIMFTDIIKCYKEYKFLEQIENNNKLIEQGKDDLVDYCINSIDSCVCGKTPIDEKIYVKNKETDVV